MNQSYNKIAALEERIGYTFKNRDLAVRALTHSSYGDGNKSSLNNERLEFLGDRILGLLTAEALFNHSSEPEGTLARRLNALVRKETCARVARQLNMGDALLVSTSEDKQGGREKTSILGDACEALIAAIYIDGGRAEIQKFYDRFWGPEIDRVVSKSAKDPKTALQELAMAARAGLPVYTVLERSGPDHKPLFVIEVTVTDIGSAKGTGKSKRDAERYAALHLLETWPTPVAGKPKALKSDTARPSTDRPNTDGPNTDRRETS
ncbi:ribonuclease III [Litorimonas sp. RW-G-Af-16]|uniref:ribonuclease III n=1 Tax=Litorimonas sp. RW-G-Af-16 TaxID=3241168 RepID=UPI00390CABC3